MLARRTQHHHPSPPGPSSPAATDGAPLTQDSVAAANCSPLGAEIPPALDWWFGGSAGATTSWSPERRASHQSSFDILPTFWPPSFWKSASTRGLTRAFCYLLLIFWIHFTFLQPGLSGRCLSAHSPPSTSVFWLGDVISEGCSLSPCFPRLLSPDLPMDSAARVQSSSNWYCTLSCSFRFQVEYPTDMSHGYVPQISHRYPIDIP